MGWFNQPIFLPSTLLPNTEPLDDMGASVSERQGRSIFLQINGQFPFQFT